MRYDHEMRERQEPREIQHVVMPVKDPRGSALMYSYLTERELDYELAVANGWYPTVSKGPRVVIPCINSARFNYWQARAMLDHPLRYDSPAIPRKDSIVFLMAGSRQYEGSGKVAITEGPMDALAASEFMPAIAVMGGKPSQEVLAFIEQKTEQLGLHEWVIIPDADNPEFIDSFTASDHGVLVVRPSGKDLAGMPAWERKKLLEKV
jgi:hypothetical protein